MNGTTLSSSRTRHELQANSTFVYPSQSRSSKSKVNVAPLSSASNVNGISSVRSKSSAANHSSVTDTKRSSNHKQLTPSQIPTATRRSRQPQPHSVDATVDNPFAGYDDHAMEDMSIGRDELDRLMSM